MAESTSYNWTKFRAFMRRQQKRLLKLGTVDATLAGSLDEFTAAIVKDIGFPKSLSQRIVVVGEPVTAEDLLHAQLGKLAWSPSDDRRT